ncbi:membrane protein of unknown function [Pararobbsia alpina]|uniref:hypothetical protein n=1 Tax=Pararobbsia alpina TaxID=621374 RepID=UPI0039A65F15
MRVDIKASNACAASSAGLARPGASAGASTALGFVTQVRNTVSNINRYEVAEGSYLAMRNKDAIGNGHPLDAILDQAKGMVQTSSSPRDYFYGIGNPGGGLAAGLCFGAGTLAYQGIIGIPGAFSEIQAASARHSGLTEQCEKVEQALGSLSQAKPVLLSEAIAVECAVMFETHLKDEIKAALMRNARYSSIGDMGLLGSSNTTYRTGMSLLLSIAGAFVPNSPGLILVTAVWGGVVTFVLMPVAAITTLASAGLIMRQAIESCNRVANERKLVEDVAASEPPPRNSFEREFDTFIDGNLSVRESSAVVFKRWCVAFLAGSCLFAASAVVSAVFGGAVMLGVAALLATPVGLGIAIAGGVIGGLVLLVCSVRFVKAYGKNKAQHSYRLDDSRFLGRRFDDLHTTYAHAMSSCVAASDSDRLRSDGLRAALHGFQRQTDNTRQAFLMMAAGPEKYYEWQARETDRDEIGELTSKRSQPYKNVLARGRYFSAYVSKRLKGATHGAALREARYVYGRYADTLTVEALASWLEGVDDLSIVNTPEGKSRHDVLLEREKTQRALLVSMLATHQEYLRKKTQAFEALQQTFFTSENLPSELEKSLGAAKAEYERDRDLLTEIDALLTEALATPDRKPLRLTDLKREFLRLQSTPKESKAHSDSTCSLDMRLARYLLEEMPEEFAATLDILPSMHAHACHVLHSMKLREAENALAALEREGELADYIRKIEERSRRPRETRHSG